MKLLDYLPSLPEVVREALIVIVGALIAAFAMSRMPKVKEWMKEQWAA